MNAKTANTKENTPVESTPSPSPETSTHSIDTTNPPMNTETVPKKKSNLPKILIIGCIVLVLLGILTIIVAFVGYKIYQDNKEKDETVQTTSTSSSTSTSTTTTVEDTKPKIIVTTPEINDVVNGEIYISGKATASLDELAIDIYDDEDYWIGYTYVLLEAEEENTLVDWEASLDVFDTPLTPNGTIYIYPIDSDQDSPLAKDISVKFATQEVPGRIKLYAPLENQAITYGSIYYFKGQMKDFFEATMSIRLLDEDGNIMFSDSVMADSDNYGKFASFEKGLELGEISIPAGTTGKWEIYDTSQADGSEEILLSFDVRFVE